MKTLVYLLLTSMTFLSIPLKAADSCEDNIHIISPYEYFSRDNGLDDDEKRPFLEQNPDYADIEYVAKGSEVTTYEIDLNSGARKALKLFHNPMHPIYNFRRTFLDFSLLQAIISELIEDYGIAENQTFQTYKEIAPYQQDKGYVTDFTEGRTLHDVLSDPSVDPEYKEILHKSFLQKRDLILEYIKIKSSEYDIQINTQPEVVKATTYRAGDNELKTDYLEVSFILEGIDFQFTFKTDNVVVNTATFALTIIDPK